jgi:microcystin-dependent protein
MAIVLDGTTGITTPAINAGNVVGQVSFFAMNTAPTGYLKANGAEISRTTYADLFTAIGTTFGVGDGSTTFDLPDLRGEFARGWDDGRAVDSGRVFGSDQTDSFQTHGHTVTRLAEASAIQNNGQAVVGVTGGGSTVSTRWAGGAPTTFGQGTPRVGSETRPRNVALLACIKF